MIADTKRFDNICDDASQRELRIILAASSEANNDVNNTTTTVSLMAALVKINQL